MNTTRDRVAELAKRRGYFFQAAEAHGGVSGFYVYGPNGGLFKRNLEELWRDRFVISAGNLEIEAPTVTPEAIFEASGHLDSFSDMLVTCPECEESHRADHLVEEVTALEDAESLPNEEVKDLIREHEITCPNCGNSLVGIDVKNFNLMFKTNIGPGASSPGYLRPETAQNMFAEFPQLKEYSRGTLPVAITQIGRAYRNEINPRRSLIRTREFTLAEIEHFIDPERNDPDISDVEDVELVLYPATEQESEEANFLKLTVQEALDERVIESTWIAYYLAVAKQWYKKVGVDMDRFRYRQHLAGERAHYASDCWDAEAEIDGDWIEISGFANRGNYDLKKHAEYGHGNFSVFQQFDESKTIEQPTVDPDMTTLGPEYGKRADDVVKALEDLAKNDPETFESGEAVTVSVDSEQIEIPIEMTGFEWREEVVSGEQVTPHVIEPSFGVDRVLFSVLCHSYSEDFVDNEERTYLSLPPSVAPTTVGVFPLMDKDGMDNRAQEIAERLRSAGISVTFDTSGNIGRRYRRQDEVGTPFCVTVDYDTLEDETVTLRERDSTEQVRVDADRLTTVLNNLIEGTIAFEDLDE
jgi:glycyl-tRNA synthetase